MKKLFRKATAPVVLSLAMMGASLPALAGTDFFKKDCRDQTTTVCQLAGEKLSHESLTFVVHGGENVLLLAAYRVAQRLDDEGVPIAFLLAPDHDGLPHTSHIDFYTKGGTDYSTIGLGGAETKDTRDFEQGLYEQALKAYREYFPELAEKTHPLLGAPEYTLR